MRQRYTFRPRKDATETVSTGRWVPAPKSDEAWHRYCGDLDPVTINGRNYWLEAKFVDYYDAYQYLYDNDERLNGNTIITRALCILGGCRDGFAVWCYRTLNVPDEHRPKGRRRPPLPRDRPIPFYWIPGQYVATEHRKLTDHWGYETDLAYGCRNADPRKCPPPTSPAYLSDWNTSEDRKLPKGVPDWAMGPLLTAAGIAAYLLLRRIFLPS